MGATRVVNVNEDTLDEVMEQLGMEEGFDVGMEMSGAPAALREMLRTMHHGGRIALLGIPSSEIAVDWNQIIFKGLTIKGIYGREMFETWYKMASMLQSGLDVSPVITHHLPADDFTRAFEVMRIGDAGKVILDWT
jgi:threonine 3-dehydrogenase